jgi:hypothetical protein
VSNHTTSTSPCPPRATPGIVAQRPGADPAHLLEDRWCEHRTLLLARPKLAVFNA